MRSRNFILQNFIPDAQGLPDADSVAYDRVADGKWWEAPPTLDPAKWA